MKIKKSFPKYRLRSGFSLVEVTLATGVMAMALSTLLGLVPRGLMNIKEAGDIAAETRITSHILGSVSQARWQDTAGSDLLEPAFDHRRYYFDDQGIAIESDEPGPDLAYVAEVRVPRQDVTLPASGAATDGSDRNDPYLRRVTVKVATVADAQFNFDRVLPLAYRAHSTLIARTGK